MLFSIDSFEIKFSINGKPIPYARARAGRNGFYNPKAKEEQKYKNEFKHQLTQESYDRLKELMKDEESLYFVEVYGDFYVPIPKSDSKSLKELKLNQIIRPIIRNGDIDNYMKLVLDALHDVVYTDDKRVTSIKANKYYSDNPRSEITVKINVIEEKEAE